MYMIVIFETSLVYPAAARGYFNVLYLVYWEKDDYY